MFVSQLLVAFSLALAVMARSPTIENLVEMKALAVANAPELPTYEECSYYSNKSIQVGCWETLNMTNYLTDWWAENGPDCESGGKGFAQCYLDNAGFITWDCDFIALNACTPPPSSKGAQYESYQQFYVFWNIYSINLFYTNYHNALLQGQAGAIGAVAEIVAAVSPPVTKNPTTPLFGPIWAVTLTEFMAMAPLLPAGTGIALAFGMTLGAGYGVSGTYSILFPTLDVVEVSWEEISAAVADNVNHYQKNIGKALTNLQTNFTEFLGMTQYGLFSQKLNTNLPENTDFMYHTLLKWIFNQAMAKAGWFIVKNPGVDPRQVPTDGFICSEFNDFGSCGPVWYDGKDSYGLARANDIGMSRSQEIMEMAFMKNWTTPEELFIDSQSCRGSNGSQAFDPDNLSLSCVSNLPICEFWFDYNPFQRLEDRNREPEFTNCPNQRGWGVNTYWGDDAGIPVPYMGPFLQIGHVYNERSDASGV